MNQNLDQAITAGQRLSRFTVRVGKVMAQWAAAQGWGRLMVLAVLALIAQHIVTDHLLHWNQGREPTIVHKHMRAPGKADDGNDEDVVIGWNGIHMSSHKRRPDSANPAGGADAGGTAPPAAPGMASPPAGAATPTMPAPAPGPDLAAANGKAIPAPDTTAASKSGSDSGKADAAKPGSTEAGKPGTPEDAVEAAATAAEDAMDDVDEEDIVIPAGTTLAHWARDVAQGLLLLLFVYLVAAKIVLRQTARSDARAAVAEASAAAASADAEHEALKRQLAEAQLQTLQAQVEPHFLFNTLASVDYLIETDPARASAMQKNLIQYLRAALPQMRTQSSQLGREADLSRAYLGILKMRMEDRLQVVVEVPEGLRSADFPPMMLQTLVENAIQHGVEPKPEGGEVRVSAHVVDGELEVTVADSGVGLSTGSASSTAGGGVGLANVRERLERLYGAQASFRLVAGVPSGAVASVRIPYRVASSGRGPAAAATGGVAGGATAGTTGGTRSGTAGDTGGAAGAPA